VYVPGLDAADWQAGKAVFGKRLFGSRFENTDGRFDKVGSLWEAGAREHHYRGSTKCPPVLHGRLFWDVPCHLLFFSLWECSGKNEPTVHQLFASTLTSLTSFAFGKTITRNMPF
jgi:hypothetical protein